MLPMVGVRARHFVINDRVLHGLPSDLGMTDLTRLQFEADSLPHWQKVETDGVSISVHFGRSQAVTEPVELTSIGRQLTATSDYNPAPHIAVGVDPGVAQAIKAGHAQRHPVTAKQDTARWSTAIQPQLLQLAAATPAGTTLGGLQAHILALKASWDALWEEYLKPRWRRQRLGLHHAQERVIEGFCKKPRPADWVPPAGQVNPRLVRPAWSLRHAKYVRGLSWCHQVPPNPPPAQAPPAQAPSPPPAQAQTLPAAPGPVQRPQAPPGGRWLDRDTNGCLKMQRIGESMQRPLELCQWKDLEAQPPVGKEYQQRYKLVNDRLPKVRQRLHRAAEYRRGIDGRARNNA
ncbi:hypothetical protein QJQ45_001689 [Haematococcus lacustris]|nr:hypothetical protein QJQ45_001689 [Haematococcus lacustris]